MKTCKIYVYSGFLKYNSGTYIFKNKLTDFSYTSLFFIDFFWSCGVILYKFFWKLIIKKIYIFGFFNSFLLNKSVIDFDNKNLIFKAVVFDYFFWFLRIFILFFKNTRFYEKLYSGFSGREMAFWPIFSFFFAYNYLVFWDLLIFWELSQMWQLHSTVFDLPFRSKKTGFFIKPKSFNFFFLKFFLKFFKTRFFNFLYKIDWYERHYKYILVLCLFIGRIIGFYSRKFSRNSTKLIGLINLNNFFFSINREQFSRKIRLIDSFTLSYASTWYDLNAKFHTLVPKLGISRTEVSDLLWDSSFGCLRNMKLTEFFQPYLDSFFISKLGLFPLGVYGGNEEDEIVQLSVGGFIFFFYFLWWQMFQVKSCDEKNMKLICYNKGWDISFYFNTSGDKVFLNNLFNKNVNTFDLNLGLLKVGDWGFHCFCLAVFFYFLKNFCFIFSQNIFDSSFYKLNGGFYNDRIWCEWGLRYRFRNSIKYFFWQNVGESCVYLI